MIIDKAYSPKFYVISGILGNYKDISPNMIEKILDSEVLFVEFIDEVISCFREEGIDFRGKMYKINFNLDEETKSIIERSLNEGKNVGIFEIGGAACFMDPGYKILNFIYDLNTRSTNKFGVVPVPGTSALMTAISICGFDMDKFIFSNFLNKYSKFDIINSELPMVYFSELSDSNDVFMNNISFMKNILDRECFIGINLGKRFSKSDGCVENLIIRGSFSEVYKKISNFSLDDNLLKFEKVIIFGGYNSKLWFFKKLKKIFSRINFKIYPKK